MATVQQRISVNKAKARVMTGDSPGSPLADKPRSGAKRPFHHWSATSQSHGAQDITLNQEDGLISLHDADSIVSSALLKDREARTYVDGDDGDSFHIEKRPRTSDWPLRSTTTSNETHSLTIAPPLDRYDTLDPPSPPPHVKPRSSKFVEGSMNDRASQKPHPSYIGDYEQLQEQFANIENDTDTKTHTSGLAHCTNRSVAPLVHNDKSEVSRPSGIFRFGKSIAAAFNPSSWKIWSKQQEENNQDKRALKERQEKAEKIYKELKRTGQIKGSTYGTHFDTHDKRTPVNRHDSGVDLEYRSSRIDGSNEIESKTIETRIEEEKKHAQMFLETPAISSFAHDESAASELSARLRSSSQNRELTLKTGETLNGPPALRRLPSRKDLQKQQKLVKRVSDLEGKLEAARRQLAEALGEPVPTQTSRASKLQFTLGTLASLPSERLLNVCATNEPDFGDADIAAELGKAVSMDDCTSTLVPNHKDKQETKYLFNTILEPPHIIPSGESVMGSNTEEIHDIQTVDLHLAEGRQVEQAAGDSYQRISDNMTSIRNMPKKRKSSGVCDADDGGRYRPCLETEDDDGSEIRKQSVPKRRPGRPRKLQKVDPEPKLLGAEATETEQAASRDIEESYSPRSSQDRAIKTSKDRRVVLSKKAPVSPSNKRIPRKGRSSTSPPSPKSSSITYPGQDVSAVMSTKQDGKFRHVVGTVPSASVDVPPIPKLPNVGGQTRVVSASNGITGTGQGTNSHDKVGGKQIRSQDTAAVTKNDRAENREQQAFEWPPDVF